jgi:23S rRNA pseudouridine2605 synthase
MAFDKKVNREKKQVIRKERSSNINKRDHKRSFDGETTEKKSYKTKWNQEENEPKRQSYGRSDSSEQPRSDYKPRRQSYGRSDSSEQSHSDYKPRRQSYERSDSSEQSSSDYTPRRQSYGRESTRNSFSDRYNDGSKGELKKRSSSHSQNRENKEIRLNRYIARSGICSRRAADELIAAGEVKVNGVLVTEMGFKVQQTDKVHVSDQLISFERPVYLLLNKPKGYITTTDDPDKRKTVMSLVANACKENIVPIGRLDRNTTGLLLFTNDGDMAKKLTHPSGNIRKVYHIHLDKALTAADLRQISEGIELDDGYIKPDVVTYVGTGSDRKEIGLELHSGRNRIVRRIFEILGYEVVKLDRVIFANLTKKDLRRGHYRFLTELEISWLKMV